MGSIDLEIYQWPFLFFHEKEKVAKGDIRASELVNSLKGKCHTCQTANSVYCRKASCMANEIIFSIITCHVLFVWISVYALFCFCNCEITA